jgi:hypothetical protein
MPRAWISCEVQANKETNSGGKRIRSYETLMITYVHRPPLMKTADAVFMPNDQYSLLHPFDVTFISCENRIRRERWYFDFHKKIEGK